MDSLFVFGFLCGGAFSLALILVSLFLILGGNDDLEGKYYDHTKRYIHSRPKPEGRAPTSRPKMQSYQPATGLDTSSPPQGGSGTALPMINKTE